VPAALAGRVGSTFDQNGDANGRLAMQITGNGSKGNVGPFTGLQSSAKRTLQHGRRAPNRSSKAELQSRTPSSQLVPQHAPDRTSRQARIDLRRTHQRRRPTHRRQPTEPFRTPKSQTRPKTLPTNEKDASRGTQAMPVT